MLDNVHISEEDTLSERFENVMDLSQFWIAVLTADGANADDIKQHSKAKLADQTIMDTIICINQQSISCKTLKGLSKKETERNRILKHVTADALRLENELKCSLLKVSEYQNNLKVITESFKILKGIPVLQLQTTAKEILKIVCEKENYFQSQMTVHELYNPSFDFKEMQDMAECCKNINTIISSGVFRNIVRQYFENKSEKDEIYNSSNEDIQEEISLPHLSKVDLSGEEKELKRKSALKIGQTIAKECFERYKRLWVDYERETDFSLHKLRTMFAGVESMTIELEQAEKVLNILFQSKTWHILIEFSKIPLYDRTLESIKVASNVFKYDNKQISFNCETIHIYEQLTAKKSSDIKMEDVIPFMHQIDAICGIISLDLQAIILAVKSSSELLDFLREVMYGDIRFLIDAVEEHSEQYVRESTVSDLIELKRFFQPVLKGHSVESLRSLFDLLQKQIDQSGLVKIPEKIHTCRENLHSLKALYRNVANRGERTIEVIENIMRRGSFHFLMTFRTCEVSVEYDQEEKESKHSDADLSDLRSRALLLMNTEDRESNRTKSPRREELEKFVKIIDKAFEVTHICMQLKQAGHFDFATYENTCNRDNLKDLKLRLKEQYKQWIVSLEICRRNYYYLNFLYADQLYELYSFLEKNLGNSEATLAILKFIDPLTENLTNIREIYRKFPVVSLGKHQTVLENIGRTFDQLFLGLKRNLTTFSDNRNPVKITEKVHPGTPYIVSLLEGNSLVIRVLLALYQSTTGIFPQAHQVLFCRKDTTFDEISLLLNRCLKNPIAASLFSIANIEMLPVRIQFLLHDEIQRLPKEGNFLLCCLCRDHEGQSFLDQFSNMLSKPNPLSDLSLKTSLNEHWGKVTVVTSDTPGLGKTEFIQRKAILSKKRSLCIHISGPLNRKSIIEGLASLSLRSYNVLHLDIGDVSDPVELDLFLFELIVLRYVSSGSTAYALSCNDIYIEIANTVNDTLCNSLQTITCFHRKHLQWMSYDNLHVSSEIKSPIQVVCHYLKSLNDGTVDTEDLYFSGPRELKPLKSEHCKLILEKHFETVTDMSYTMMNNFLNVSADQLKRLSSSVFFRCSNLCAVTKEGQVSSVKSSLVKTLLDVSKDFALRSVNSCRSVQTASMLGSLTYTPSVDILTERLSGMIRWEDNNHLVVLFHQNFQTVSALYRHVKEVPQSIKDLFEYQMNCKLTDYSSKSPNELLNLLLMLARKSDVPVRTEVQQNLMKNYALTPDNLLKMILISMRVNANVPILIMGETGCGKTSLIQFLANVCGVKFDVFSLHAGIEESDIVTKLQKLNDAAYLNREAQYWLFLDEINTCDHLGLISNAICHRMLCGKDLAPNLVLLSACNPYRLRGEEEILTHGLQGKIKTDELSKLVYRVHPLPETLIDYVWDYGSLNEIDEASYIKKMVKNVFDEKVLTKLLADTLIMSQQYVRTAEQNDYCVSLRDVDRCKKLVIWFYTFLAKKNVNMRKRDREIQCIILGTAICYHSRFSHGSTRRNYRTLLGKCISSIMPYRISEKTVLDVILNEQKDILDRMTELPAGTALNAALQENVFTLLVCILNKLPIFLVGKPGCSKSLSMQLIRSNLRGKDSSNPLFQEMPQLFCVSFQGSESSTSDGIENVFKKAEKYQKHNDERDVLSVVILDEIGLAEISKFNPLKILHKLIEPNTDELKLAVVGISNWALDAAKMNRAIHLSRPDMDLDELIYTGQSLSTSMMSFPEFDGYNQYLPKVDPFIQQITNRRTVLLEGIANAYYKYCTHDQKFPNFHGLRDFYSLTKYLAQHLDINSLTEDNELHDIFLMGILRNFGGLPTERERILDTFKSHIPEIKSERIPVTRLILENIKDNTCRHLMLITNGDAVINVLENQLEGLKMPFEIIFGSRFEDDVSNDYNYRILSRIILCMEQGMVLILKDLESIYGSLYDMLNQNYTVVGKKKHCRVALGHYSNPMCHVHDDFKCIVLVEESKLDYSDPPFLSRFEKQLFEFSDLLENDDQIEAVNQIKRDFVNFCQIPNHTFSPYDVIPSYSQNLLVSLIVFSQQQLGIDASVENITKLAFGSMLWLIPPEVVIRSNDSVLFEKIKTNDAIEIINKYIKLPIHGGICSYLESLHLMSNEKIYDEIHVELSMSKKKSNRNTKVCDRSIGVVGDNNFDYNPIEDTGSIQETYNDENTIDDISIIDKQAKDQQKLLKDFEKETVSSDSFANKNQLSIQKRTKKATSHYHLCIAYTFSGINSIIETNINERKIHREKLTVFKSEKMFFLKIEEFFRSDSKIFLLQCLGKTDSRQMLLVKVIIERYIRLNKVDMSAAGKQICIVIHLERNGLFDLPFNFLSGWKLMFLDSIQKPETNFKQFLELDRFQIVKERIPFEVFINEKMFWAFSRIQFVPNSYSARHVEESLKQMQTNSSLTKTLQTCILSWTEKTQSHINVTTDFDSNDLWCTEVAKDVHAILQTGTFMGALESNIQNMMKVPLAIYMFVLHEHNLLSCLFVEDEYMSARGEVLAQMVISNQYANIDTIPEPSGPECYYCSSEYLNFHMPFSQIILRQIHSRKEEYLDFIWRLRIAADIDTDEEMPKELFDKATTDCVDLICYEVARMSEDLLYPNKNDDFIRDFCYFHSLRSLDGMNEQKRISIFQWALSNFIDIDKIRYAEFFLVAAYLHACLWVYGQTINAICEIVKLSVDFVGISPVNGLTDFKEDDTVLTLSSSSTITYEKTDGSEKKLKEEELTGSTTPPSEITEPDSKESNQYTGHHILDLSKYDTKSEDFISQIKSTDDVTENRMVRMSIKEFVKTLCFSILPTGKLIEKHPIYEWQILISKVLPLARIVNDDCPERTALQFCREIVEILCEADCPSGYITDIGQCMTECFGKLDSMLVCECLYTILKKLQNENNVKPSILQRLFCSYVSKCIISNPDNTLPLTFALNRISASAIFDNTLTFFGQVVKFAVMIDLTENEYVYLNILQDIDESNEHFARCFDNHLVDMDITIMNNMALPILLVDALEQYAFDDSLTVVHLESIQSSSDETLQCLSCSFRIVETGIISLKFTIAIAFIRKFIALFAQLLEANKYDGSSIQLLAQHVNSKMVKSTNNKYSAFISTEILHLFFKHIDQSIGHQNINRICRKMEPYIPVLKKVMWTDAFVEQSAVFNPLFLYLDKDNFNLIYTQLVSAGRKNNKLGDILIEKKDVVTCLGVIAQTFFMSRCLKEKDDSEIRLASRIADIIDKIKITKEIKCIISSLLGITDFKHNLFDLSIMVESPQPQIVSVMLHLTCIIGVLSPSNNYWHRIVMMPLSFEKCYLPLTTFNKCKNKERSSNGFDDISEVTYDIMQLFLHSCVVISLELDATSPEVVMNCIDIVDNNAHSHLELQIRQYWQSLQQLLQINCNDLCILLHTILFKTQHLFTSTHNVIEEADITTYLLKHASVIDKLLPNRFYIIQESKQHNASLSDTSSEMSMVNCVTEVKPCHYDEHVNFVTRLFRVYRNPTKDKLFANFKIASLKQAVPFLHLTLQNIDKLCLPQKMLSILKWHLSLVAGASYKFRKVDFKDLTVAMVIAEEHDERRKILLEKTFELFKNDWNEVCSYELNHVSCKHTDSFEFINTKTKMKDISAEDEHSPLQNILKKLIAIQNNFLIEACESKSLNEKPRSVTVLDIRKKDLLKFEWNDRFLTFSQCDTGQGFAQKIDFDYEKIEQEMKAEILFGKCFVTMENLPKIFFTDVLFQNSVDLLKEIQVAVRQQQLTSEIKREIEKKMERNVSQITNLLTYTGMALSLIRKTGAQPDQPIAEYLKKWESFTGKASWESKHLLSENIQICHSVSLYQFLEELNGEKVSNSLNNTYRSPLPKAAKDSLLKASKVNIVHIEKLDHAVKVFVHRCLSSSTNALRIDQPLIDYLCCEHFWWNNDYDNVV